MKSAQFGSQAIRLVRYGLRLMNGGYLDLLQAERRMPADGDRGSPAATARAMSMRLTVVP